MPEVWFRGHRIADYGQGPAPVVTVSDPMESGANAFSLLEHGDTSPKAVKTVVSVVHDVLYTSDISVRTVRILRCGLLNPVIVLTKSRVFRPRRKCEWQKLIAQYQLHGCASTLFLHQTSSV